MKHTQNNSVLVALHPQRFTLPLPTWAFALLAAMCFGCSAASNADLPKGAKQIGTISIPDLKESSGLAPSLKDPNIVWSHNDGKRFTLYAMTRAGKLVNQYVIATSFQDWEDIASDHAGHLYLADTGNNEQARKEISVHEIDEPDPTEAAQLPVSVKRTWHLRFPQKPFDCESLFVWKGNGYLVSKVFNDEQAGLYRFSLQDPKGPVVLQLLGELKVQSPVTGADLSPHGHRLALVSRRGVCLINSKGEPETFVDHKPVWARFKHEHIEGICFVPEGLLVSAESREIYLFNDSAFEKKKE